MEKEIQDKINKVATILKEKIEDFDKKYETFRDEFMTSELKKIVKDIVINSRHEYVYTLNSMWTIRIDEKGNVKFYSRKNEFDFFNFLWISPNVHVEYSDFGLGGLQRIANELMQNTKLLEEWMDQAEDIIADITKMYQIRNENRIQQINDIMNLLNVDEPKLKHIKVTVEWI